MRDLGVSLGGGDWRGGSVEDGTSLGEVEGNSLGRGAGARGQGLELSGRFLVFVGVEIGGALSGCVSCDVGRPVSSS